MGLAAPCHGGRVQLLIHARPVSARSAAARFGEEHAALLPSILAIDVCERVAMGHATMFDMAHSAAESRLCSSCDACTEVSKAARASRPACP